jgi:hypothetical protein
MYRSILRLAYSWIVDNHYHRHHHDYLLTSFSWQLIDRFVQLIEDVHLCLMDSKSMDFPVEKHTICSFVELTVAINS